MRTLALALLSIGFCLAAESDNEIFAPPANAAFPKGPVRFVARAVGDAKPTVDGKPVTTESPYTGVLKGEMDLPPGAHEIALGDKKARFFVGEGAPAEFKLFREHPAMQTGCDTCHAVRNDAWRFKRISLANVCSQCHDKVTFQKKHTHEMGIIQDCQMCHAPHGSTAVASLKMTKDKACQICHPLK